MYTCHSNRAKCRCGTKLSYLETSPPCTCIPQNTHMTSSAPLPSPLCGCFSAYTYVSALRRYQACLMQWTCISISAGQTQINRNVLKKNVSNKFLCKSGRERERAQHTNEPISLIWKWTKTFLMKTPRSGRGEGMHRCLFTFWFSSGFGQLTSLLLHRARWWKYQKASRYNFILILKMVILGEIWTPF